MQSRCLPLISAVLTLSLAACGGGGGEETPPVETSSPSGAVSPSGSQGSAAVACAAPAGQSPGGALLHQDDLSDASVWGLDEQTILQGDGCLVISAQTAGDTIEAAPSIEDFQVPGSIGGTLTGLPRMALEVDAGPVQGGPGSFFGLVCGVTEDLKYYLGVGGDGTAVIAEAQGSNIETVAAEPAAADAVVAGQAQRLRAECDVGAFEAVFAVHLGGKELISKKVSNLDILDASDTFHLAGVVAGVSEGPAQISFDDFSIHELP